MNKDLLRAKMQERKITVTELSNRLSINQSTFYRKLNADGDTFSVAQTRIIARTLSLSSEEINHIIFG